MSTDDKVKKTTDYHLCRTIYSKSFNDFPQAFLFSARWGIRMEYQR
jgi:hypothetical protein